MVTGLVVVAFSVVVVSVVTSRSLLVEDVTRVFVAAALTEDLSVVKSVVVTRLVVTGVVVTASLAACDGCADVKVVTGVVVVASVVAVSFVVTLVVAIILVPAGGVIAAARSLVVVFVVSDGCVKTKLVSGVVVVSTAVVVSFVITSFVVILAGMSEFVLLAPLSPPPATDVVVAGTVDVSPVTTSVVVTRAMVTVLVVVAPSVIVVFVVTLGSCEPKDVTGTERGAAVSVVSSIVKSVIVM